MENPNSQLDPQDEISSLAQMTPEDLAEYHEWLNYINTQDLCQFLPSV